MARPLRVEYAGAYYHVMNRGNAGEDIFCTVRDREKFLAYLGAAVERFGIVIHTYCLMNNHYHLLVETPEANLSAAMKWCNVSYAAYFNRKHQRKGHLFHGRFKALLVDADEYLKELSRYIHLNPVRAGLTSNPSEYRWSSYSAFVGKAKVPDWLAVDWLLGLFGRTGKETKRRYRAFVEEPGIESIEDPAKDAVNGFILGSPDFISWVKETFLSKQKEHKEVPQLKRLKPRVSVEKIVQVVCDEAGCTEEQIREKGHKRNSQRDMAIYLTREMTGASAVELGMYFGGVSGAAITMRRNAVAQQLSRNKRFKGRVDRIKKRIINI